ncbi:MAG: hypothetical protein FJX68_05495 [Alphaproteobacteria bacterium]|nr:hypothetical protein [Alphaproteobacteria bacterium]
MAAGISLLLLDGGWAQAASSADERAWAAGYVGPMAETLEVMYAGRQSGQNSYCIFRFGAKSSLYAQCLAAPGQSNVFCETVSAGSSPAAAKLLTPARVGALQALGFKPPGEDSPNHHLEITLDRKERFRAVARLLLQAMHDGYGYRGKPRVQQFCASPPPVS